MPSSTASSTTPTASTSPRKPQTPSQVVGQIIPLWTCGQCVSRHQRINRRGSRWPTCLQRQQHQDSYSQTKKWLTAPNHQCRTTGQRYSYPGEIISQQRATSSRNPGRHHVGIPGRLRRNLHNNCSQEQRIRGEIWQQQAFWSDRMVPSPTPSPPPPPFSLAGLSLASIRPYPGRASDCNCSWVIGMDCNFNSGLDPKQKDGNKCHATAFPPEMG
jgi:hypothetical protein